MRDYNYFTLVKRTKRQKARLWKIPDHYMIIILIVGLLGLTAWPAINQARMLYKNYQINQYNRALLEDSRYPLFQIVEQKQAELANSQSTVSSLQQASNMIFEKEIINEKLLHAITEVLPADTHLTSLSLSGQTVTMSGLARSRAAIAELLYNLRNSGNFGQPFVTSLSESNQFYQFNLNLELVGGGIR